MNKIRLNNTEFEISGYTKTTYFNGENINSTGNIQIIDNNTSGINALALETITSIQITHDGDVIYSLSNLNAHIETINEYLNNDRMDISANLRFDMEQEAKEE